MAISQFAVNSQACDSTERSIGGGSVGPTSNVTDGFFQCWLDLNALAAGDTYVLRLYEKVNGSTQRLAESWTFSGVQGKPIFATPGMLLVDGWDFTLQKVAGTDRTIQYSIRQAS